MTAVVDRFQLLVDAVEEYAIFILEIDGTIASWNSGAERIKGYTAAEIIGRPFSVFYSDEDNAAGKPANELIHASEHGEYREEGWRLRKDGSRFWAYVVITAIHDGLGNLTGFAKVTRDDSARRLAETAASDARIAAEAANRDKDEFMSRMSHELRTPLNAILGFSQLMELEGLRADQQEHVGYVLRASHHLLTLVDDVLDISRMATGGLRLAFEPVGINDVVDEAVEMLRTLAKQHSVEIVPAASSLHAAVWGDRQRILQVTLNLLSNAIKYNVVGGTVRLRGEIVDTTRFRLTVEDTGGGIDAADLDRLFRPFERLAAEHTAVEGSGLGLALTRELVAAMHGDVGVTSIVGQGSSFWVELPIAGEPPPRPRHRPEPLHDAAPAAATGITVLYIEDNPPNVKLVERTLARRSGVTLLAATDGRSGYELAVERQPDLILLDLHLPDISGDEVLRLVRAHPVIAATPVVMLTADAMADRPASLLAKGANAFLTKPFNITHLLSLVDDVSRAAGSRLPEPRHAGRAGNVGTTLSDNDAPGPCVADRIHVSSALHEYVHNMNGQLGIVLNYCSLLHREAVDPALTRDLAQMHAATTRAVELTRALTRPSADDAGPTTG